MPMTHSQISESKVDSENRPQKSVPFLRSIFHTESTRDEKSAPKTNMADNNNELDDVAAAVTVIAILAHKESKNRKRKRSTWIQPWIQNRTTHGA